MFVSIIACKKKEEVSYQKERELHGAVKEKAGEQADVDDLLPGHYSGVAVMIDYDGSRFKPGDIDGIHLKLLADGRDAPKAGN